MGAYLWQGVNLAAAAGTVPLLVVVCLALFLLLPFLHPPLLYLLRPAGWALLRVSAA